MSRTPASSPATQHTQPHTPTANAMKHTNSTPAAQARATVSAFTILIERSLQILGQALMPRLETLQPAPVRRARTGRGG